MKQILAISTLAVCAVFGITGCNTQDKIDRGFMKSQEFVQTISPYALMEWQAYGRGTVEAYREQAVVLREEPGSSGLMLVSPETYGVDVVLRYRLLTLQPGTVMVTILSVSGSSGEHALLLPAEYDGSIGPWMGPNPNYFFAYHNAAHMRHPFVMRVGTDGNALLEESERAHMSVGRWYDIEVGRHGGLVWLSINSERVLETEDSDPLGPGKVAFRIRGTGPEIASVMIRDVRIFSY